MTKKQNPADGDASGGDGGKSPAGKLPATRKSAEQALTKLDPRLPTLTWRQVLADVDLVSVQFPPDPPTDRLLTARELVTPEMRAALPDWKQRALDRLASDAEAMTDPLASPLFCGRMLSMTVIENVQKEIVIDAVAPAMSRRTGESYDDARFDVADALADFADEEREAGRTARPIFEHEEYERMAHFALECVPAKLRATSEREFLADGKPVATATINAFLHNVLSRCHLYSARASDAPATINNRLISEVRAALARVVHQAPVSATPATPDISPVAAFCDRHMRLDPTESERTPSTLMFEAWLAQCSEDERQSWSEATFIKQVRQWAEQRGGRLLDEGRGRHMGKWVTWYRGVVLLLP